MLFGGKVTKKGGNSQAFPPKTYTYATLRLFQRFLCCVLHSRLAEAAYQHESFTCTFLFHRSIS